MLRRLSEFLTRSVRARRREGAACYRFDGSLFLCAINEVRNGPGVEWEPFLLLPVTASDDAVGAALTQVLDGSGQVLDLVRPEELHAARAEQLRAAGLSSERRLQQSAIRCGIERLPSRVRFTPCHNGGTRGDTKGFRDLEQAATVVDLPASEADLGEALRAALGACTSCFDPGSA